MTVVERVHFMAAGAVGAKKSMVLVFHALVCLGTLDLVRLLGSTLIFLRRRHSLLEANKSRSRGSKRHCTNTKLL